MATAEEQVREINEKRMRIWERGKELLDRAASETRDLTQEEQYNYDRLNDDMTAIDSLREKILNSDRAQREFDSVNEELRRVATPDERGQMESRDAQQEAEVRSFFRAPSSNGLADNLRQVNSIELDLQPSAAYFQAHRAGMPFSELRTYQTDSGSTGGSLTVPSLVANTIYAFMVNSNSIRKVSRVFTTSGGGPMAFPRVTTHSLGTQIASQTTALTVGTAVLGAMTLQAYDFGQLSAVSNDMLEDSGVDVIGFVGEQIGRSLGIVTGVQYATGSGSGTPTGVITAAPLGANGTVATQGTTIAQVNTAGGLTDPFIDLQYSIADSYRNNGCAFVVNQLTAGQLRKARSQGGTGDYLWQPSPAVGLIPGQPDRFLGDPIYGDANIASIASNAKIAVYGDWSAFYIRDVGTVRLERSDDLYFNLNQVAFRGILRTDSNLIDTKALNVLKMSL